MTLARGRGCTFAELAQGIDDCIEQITIVIFLIQGARTSGPSRQDCPLLVRCQVTILDDIYRLAKCVGRIE